MWDENRKSTNCIYSNNNLTVKKTGPGFWNCGVIGNVAVDTFTVRLDMEKTIRYGGGVTIGFTTGDIWNLNDYNSNNNGWFIAIYDGNLFGIGLGGQTAPYSSKIIHGDYITVIREGNSIRFKKNKIDL